MEGLADTFLAHMVSDDKHSDWNDWSMSVISPDNVYPVPDINSNNHLERSLVDWYHVMQSKYRCNLLTESEIETLSKLDGWKWNVEKDLMNFFEFAHDWKVWYMTYGTPPNNHTSSSQKCKRLFNWAKRIKEKHKQGRISIAELTYMQNVDGWVWKTYKDRKSFQQYLIDWKTFYEEYGRRPTARDGQLYKWQYSQLKAKLNGKLSERRNRLLEETTGWIWEDEISFHIRYSINRWMNWISANRNNYPNAESSNDVEREMAHIGINIRNWWKQDGNGVLKNELIRIPFLRTYLGIEEGMELGD